MTNTDKQIVVRFPPSPTGEIHIGNMRTLLFNYLFARKNNGKIVFRFEDTDKERSKKEFEQGMIDGLATLGLDFDEGPYRQSERAEIYRKYLHLLVEKGLAYEAEENTAGTGKVIRIKNIERDIIWNDLVKGEIKINTHTFKDESGNADLVIARSIDDAIYHFTVVVDDWLMGVTHVVRGDDHVTSTPRQIMILEALIALEGLIHEGDVVTPIIPTYAHLPTIIGEDKKKLSKRNGVTALKSFLDLGYLPETMVNYLALLGWNPGDEREFFTLPELVQEFSFERCNKSPAQFDFKKLDNINKHYLNKLSVDDFVGGALNVLPEEYKNMSAEDLQKFKKIILLVYRERISKFREILDADTNGENNYYFETSYNSDFANFDINKICFKTQTLDEAKLNLKLVLEKIQNLEESNWSAENLKNIIWDWSAEVGRGGILHPLRTILSLKEKSPDPFVIMDIIGKTESLRRLQSVL